jgi:hypothetical protein
MRIRRKIVFWAWDLPDWVPHWFTDSVIKVSCGQPSPCDTAKEQQRQRDLAAVAEAEVDWEFGKDAYRSGMWWRT